MSLIEPELPPDTDYDRTADSDNRFGRRRKYDDVYDTEGNLLEPMSVLDDPF